MINYFYSENNEKIGPLSFDELKLRNIKRDTLIWTKGMKSWEKAGDIDDLSDLFEFNPPSLPNENADEAPDLPQNTVGMFRSYEKECPICFEIVKKEAIFCKHCKSNIDENINNNPIYNPPQEIKKTNPLATLIKYIVTPPLLYLGALGLYEHFTLGVEGALPGGIISLTLAFAVLFIFSPKKNRNRRVKVQNKYNKRSNNDENYDGVSMAMHQINNDMDDDYDDYD